MGKHTSSCFSFAHLLHPDAQLGGLACQGERWAALLCGQARSLQPIVLDRDHHQGAGWGPVACPPTPMRALMEGDAGQNPLPAQTA